MKAIVSEITGFSTHDGPGIRTTVFLKGCPLRCKWCSNPETFQPKEMLYYIPSRCGGCGKCQSRCPQGIIGDPSLGYGRIDRSKCDLCRKCVDVCLNKAFQISGVEYTCDELFHRVLRDKPFYGEDGGLTFSGGEALQHADFVKEMFSRCKAEKISTVLDTTGYAKTEKLLEVLEYTDLVLLDLKHMDPDVHKKWTGVSNELILNNAKIIASKVKTRISLPLIPDVNNSEENLKATAEFVRELGIKWIDINPFHKLGDGKYHYLGMDSPYDSFRTLEKHEVEDACRVIKSFGLDVNIGRMM